VLQSYNKSVAKMWWRGETISASNVHALFTGKREVKKTFNLPVFALKPVERRRKEKIHVFKVLDRKTIPLY